MALILDGTAGETFPSWTTATRPASPAVGQMGYNTTIGQFDCYTSGGWVSVATTTSTSNKLTASQMPTGSVVQVVTAYSNTSVSSTTLNSWVDTTLTASITPTSASNKVLILLCQQCDVTGSGNDAQMDVQALRNSTAITGAGQAYDFIRLFVNTGSFNGNFLSISYPIMYLDSPATTSSTTYKTQFSLKTAGTATAQKNNNLSYIQLLEIVG